MFVLLSRLFHDPSGHRTILPISIPEYVLRHAEIGASVQVDKGFRDANRPARFQRHLYKHRVEGRVAALNINRRRAGSAVVWLVIDMQGSGMSADRLIVFSRPAA